MYLARETSISALRHTLSSVDDLAGISRLIFTARDMLGIDNMFYHWVNAPDGQIGLGTYPEAWVRRYIAAGYDRIDPVILGTKQSFAGRDWKEFDWSHRNLRDFLAESASYGLSHQGLSLPIHGPHGEFAVLTANHACSDDDWATFARTRADELMLLGAALHTRVRRICHDRQAQGRVLSPREADVLYMLALGHSRADAARRLEISEHTLRDHLQSARAKLVAQNTTHAVAQAIAQGRIVL